MDVNRQAVPAERYVFHRGVKLRIALKDRLLRFREFLIRDGVLERMRHTECARKYFLLTLLLALLVASVATSGCTNAEAAKAQHVSRGEAFLKEKKFQEASIEFRNAIQIDDKLGSAHWGLARAYEGLERWQEMIDELRRAIDLDAKNLDARVRLGNYYLAPLQHTPEAIVEAERLANDVLGKNPNHIEGNILLANVLYLQDRAHPEKALAKLNHAIELDPNRVESHLSLARFYLNTKDVAKAEESFRRAISVNDASALAHTEYAKFLVQANRLNDAEAQMKKAIEAEPKSRDPRFMLASFYLINKQLDKAEEAFKALAEVEKDKPDGRAVLADFYSSVGRYDEAVNVYQDIAASAPDYTRAHYRLGEIMLLRGDIKGATAQVEEVLKKNDRDMQARLLRSRIYMQSGQPKQAVEDLKEVLKQEPNSRPGLYFMAEASMSAGQTEQARSFAADLDKYYPNYLPGKLLQAQISLAAGDVKNALRLSNDLLERLSKSAPDRDTSPQLLAELRAKALTARGTAEIQSNDTRAARQDFQAARDAAPNDPASYVNLAAVAAKENKTDEAINLYGRALEIDNANFNALSNLINVYALMKRFDQAHARIDQSLSAHPDNASLHFLKAQIYGYEQNAQGAENELRRTIELDPNYLAAYDALGKLYINLNQQDRAIAELRKIIERRPDNAATYTLIGMLEDSRRNHDAANENYRKALEADQNATIAANNLAWSYAVHNTGNLDEAVRLAQGLVQRYPDQPGFADTLGWVYYKKGLHAAAVEQLQKAVARAGNSATYRYHLGMALAGKGDKASARRELEQALRLGQGNNSFPDADDARKTLATL